MDTTTVLPEYPPGGGASQELKAENKITFQQGEFVLMRSKRIERKEILRFHELYGKTLPIETWWNYIAKDYNKQVQFAKDLDDNHYYMFHSKYIGVVKQTVGVSHPYSLIQKEREVHTRYIVEWEAREDVMPGESQTRQQEHYPENLISMSRALVMTKEEIVRETLHPEQQNPEIDLAVDSNNNT